MSAGTVSLLAALLLLAAWFSWRWYRLESARRTVDVQARPTAADLVTGFVTDFCDTLGIGSFAPTTTIFKLRRRMPDERIPGTLNVGHALPTVVQALVFIAAVTVDLVTLAGMIAAAVAGAWLGVGIVARLDRRTIQLAMGVALLVAAALFVAKNAGAMPAGGEAVGLAGATLVFAVASSFVLGALMMLGIGFYAPCLVLVSLLGMNPLAAFPIMMGSCAFLMPAAGVRIVATGRYDLAASLGLTLGGVPGVLVAAFVVQSLPMDVLRWLVVAVVTYAAVRMLAGDGAGAADEKASAPH